MAENRRAGRPGVLSDETVVGSRIREGSHGRDTDRRILLLSTAVDAGNTPTTTLRKGVALGKITATDKFKEYNPAGGDGSEGFAGILADEVDMLLSGDGVTPVDQQGILIGHGVLREDRCYLVDAAAKADPAGLRIDWR